MRRSYFPFFGFLLGTFVAWWVYPVAAPFLKALLPIEWWFEVRSVEVRSTRLGEMPRVLVDRSIRRPFTANWIVTVRRSEEEGFAAVCSREGRDDYRPLAELPNETDLNWWLDVPPNEACPVLIPGRYIVTFAWQIEIEGISPRVVRFDSNIFEVKA